MVRSTLIYKLPPVALTLAIAMALPSAALAQQDAPSFAREPLITEYDVDASWPQVPEGVSSTGWVSGLAVDDQDQVWFFRKGPNPVQVYKADGQFVRTWGKERFKDPHHLRIDQDGNIWVADFGHHVVEKYTPEGELLLTLGTRGEAGDDETHFYRPTDMVIADNGDIFVTDGYGNRRVVHLDKHGKYVKSWGEYGSGPGQFVLPHAIAMDSAGLLYVADRNSGRIEIFDQQGNVVDQWSNIIMPWGLTINQRDEIWVCGSSPHWWKRNGEYPEYKDQVILRFSTDGRVRQMWTIPLGEQGKVQPGEAIGIHCIDQDSQGNLYVGDIYGERAQKFVPVAQRTE